MTMGKGDVKKDQTFVTSFMDDAFEQKIVCFFIIHSPCDVMWTPYYYDHFEKSATQNNIQKNNCCNRCIFLWNLFALQHKLRTVFSIGDYANGIISGKFSNQKQKFVTMSFMLGQAIKRHVV